jgi:outer membrane receptor protein involved in Fe transport
MKKLIFLISLLIFGSMLNAQVTTSGISGKIYGADKATLPGATVVIVHIPSGTQYATVTDNDGFYRIPNMKVGGPYKLTVTYVGYKTFIKDDITLSLGQTLSLNQTLSEEAAAIEGVVITAGVKNAIMDGNRTGASTNINVQQIQNLPSINRSITDFTKLTPQSNGSSFGGQDGRYNNITIDGANFNNNFGLSTKSLPGGDAQPISLDAIEEINVNIAPYDIRQSNFTGANVNAITRSGDNTWKGSVYGYYRDKSFNGKKVEDQTLTLSDQTINSYGFRVGGPILKDKLFIFLNAEREKSSFPGIPWRPSDPENGVNADAAKSISRTTVQDLKTIHDLLYNTYGYEAGSYQNFGNFASQNTKFLGRIDWNINKHNKFTTRFNYVTSTNDQQVNPTSAPGTRSTFGRIGEKSMSFSNANYGFLNTVSSITAELNSTWNSTANKLLFTYTKIQDTRSSNSADFPFVDIYKDGDPYMSFGYELFTKDNDVINNVLTFTDNFNYFLGKHTFTLGASFDKLFFGNSYKRYGTSYYRFASMQDFIDNKAPTTFGLTYPYGNGTGYAELNFGYGSVYGQDEYQATDNLKLTAGIRLELPVYINDLAPTPPITALTFNDLDGKPIKLDAGAWPKSKVTFSPRFGFNWDATGDKSIQVRGGTGIFTGRLPFVWFTNQPTNSGTLQNTVEITKASDLAGLTFNKDPFYHLSNTTLFPATPSSAAPGSIAVVGQDFKMPQVWRSNLATDIKLPWWDLIMTLEGIYSKDINAVMQYNANQTISDSTFLGPDKRVRYFATKTGTVPSRRINSAISNAMVLDNSKEGYSYSLTIQLAKTLTKGFSGMIAYTYSGAKDLTSNPGSAAASAWSSNPAVTSQNEPGVSYSKFAVPHRVVGSLSYRKEYLNHLATSISVFFQGSSQDRLDYIYSNDMNGDGNASDLMYIPKDATEIIFDDIKKTDGTVIFDAAAQNTAFWKYVDQDDYLSKHKGEYAERYGVIMPWVSRFDVKILQDVFTKFGATKHSLQISLDLLNVGNLINSNWGIYRKQTLGSYDITLLKYSKTGTGATDKGIPHYQLNYTGSDLPTSTYTPVLSTSSTWGAQIGIRYTF